jgi:hypothetical protein
MENQHGMLVPKVKKNGDDFRREIYICVIDQISQKHNNQFDEVNIDVLIVSLESVRLICFF